ncbi:unnamed protein product, partial [Ixodes hexagonus]
MYTNKEIEDELVTCGLLNKHFAERCTAHGFSRIASTGSNGLQRLTWVCIVIVAVGGFLYHISFLTSNYFSYPIMTATEEVHADELHFPSITVCNLNLMRKSFFEDYLKDVAAKSGYPISATTERPSGNLKTKTKDLFSPTTKGYSYDDDTEVCYKTVEEFLKTSRTMDLSDMWMNFIATKEHLMKFGHKANDLVVQCTYNARNCFDETRSILRVDPYPSPRYGLCQTIKLANDSMRKIRKTGPTLGLRLTLNIERSEYLDIISPEFGARLLIHPVGTAPTLERGGIILTPGSKSYISIRMRKIQRLPEPYRGCSKSFNDSKITPYLQHIGMGDLIQRSLYTFDYCQTLCREAALLRTCDCLDELSTNGRAACDPCNITQDRCREACGGLRSCVRSYHCSDDGHGEQEPCRNCCSEPFVVRVDGQRVDRKIPFSRQRISRGVRISNVSLRIEYEYWNLIPNKIKYFRIGILKMDCESKRIVYTTTPNVVVPLQLPQLFADLGGCLGLYIGVSAITIFEFLEHLLALIRHIANKFMGRDKRSASRSP